MIKQNYASPRWSGEICDCSMPMTFDTYSTCSFNCLYCFAFFQKSHNVIGYKGESTPENRTVRSVNPERVKQLFKECLSGEFTNKTNREFEQYVKNKITMQWGGLADGFDDNEQKYGISLDLLKFFDKIDYPLSISTKGTFFTKNKEYMDIIKKHSHNWHFKISIITNNKFKAKKMEEGVPTPQERLKAIKRLADNNINVTLRLRPYIMGLSDDYPDLIEKASNNGANSVTTEFFCLESRADEQLKNKYKQMSNIVGYDLWTFYKKNSYGPGYRRLNYDIKRNIIKDMKNQAHKNKMLFYVSDAHHKEKSDDTCCCGCPPHFKVFRGHFAEALQIAKRNPQKTVSWEDIEKQNTKILSTVPYECTGFNTENSKTRALRANQTMSDYLQTIWNTPQNGKSPYKYFEKILYPVGKTEKNNIIYKYWEEKANK